MKKLVTAIIVIFIAHNVLITEVAAIDKEAPELAPEAVSAILIERDTGQVLYDKNIDEQLPPASMTKIMTMILIMEAIDEGKIQLNEKVRASEHAASMGGSQIFLEEGEEMSVEELLKSIAIASANDASVALAEYIAGSEEAFVEQMNEKAKALGLKNTHFVNSTGLPADNHYSSAYDMAMMSKELLKHEEVTKYTGLYEDYLREDSDDKFWLVNTNRLVKFYPGVDGLKTGYTSEAKYCLSATAKKDDMRAIAVVMGSKTPKERNSQITKMFDYAFSQYTVHKIHDGGVEVDEVGVDKGVVKQMPVVTGDKVSILTHRGESTDNISTKIMIDSNLHAPIAKGDAIGKLLVEKDGETLSETPLLAAKDVNKASWWKLLKRTIGSFAGA